MGHYENSHVKLVGRFLRHFSTTGRWKEDVEKLHSAHLEAWELVGYYPPPRSCHVSDTCKRLISLSLLKRSMEKEEALSFLQGVTDLVHRWNLHCKSNKAVWATEDC